MRSFSISEFDALVDRYFSVLTFFARRWAPESAEDVAQETFLKLLTVASKRGAPDNVPAWLFQTAKTTAIDESRRFFRRKKFRERYEQEREIFFEESPDVKIFAQETTARLRTLSDDARQLVLLRVWGELSFEEIAKIVGLPKTNVFREYRKALETLRGADKNGSSNAAPNDPRKKKGEIE